MPSIRSRVALCGAVLSLAAACGAKDAPSSRVPTVAAAEAAGGAAAAGSGSSASAPGPAAGAPVAAQRFAAWLAAFNTGERAAVIAFREANVARDASEDDVGSVEAALGLFRFAGGFVLRRTEASTATRHVALVQEQDSDTIARVELDVDAAPPHLVRKLQIEVVPAPPDLAVHRMSEAEALAALRAGLEKAVAADKFSGAILVAKHGVPVFSAAYGLADREKKVPNTLDTRFRIGSMNKMFTATAVMALVQARKLEPTTPLAKVLPGYPNRDLAAKVMIHHLLTHTGGTGDIFGPEFERNRLTLRTHQDYLALYGQRALAFEPGAEWRYSNYGFVLLGAVIEKLTGQSYYDAVSRLVYKPAGMARTASPPEDQGGPDRAVAYTRRDPTGPWTSAADTLPYRGTAAGGGDSTVGDLLRFANALTGHKLLDAKHTELLTSNKVKTGGPGQYAYGFSETLYDGVRCVGHNGGAPGMNGQLAICDSGYTIAVLANMDPPAASRWERFVATRLPAN